MEFQTQYLARACRCKKTVIRHSKPVGIMPPSFASAVSNMRNILIILVIVAVLGGGYGVWVMNSSTPATTAATPAMDKPLLRIHGSNTIGEHLMPQLATAYLQKEGYANVRLQNLAPVENLIVARQHPSRPNVNIEIKAHGSSTSFVSLAEGAADLGMSSRRIKSEEVEKLSALGDMTADGQEHIIALDALAVIVHPENPLKQMTLEQIAQIFSGQISDWSSVGAPAGAITVLARDDKSGTWDTFDSLVLKPAKVKLVDGAKRFESSEELATQVSNDRNAIGFVGIAHVYRSKPLAVAKDNNSPFALPSRHTIGTENYVLSRRLYLYQPKPTGGTDVVTRFIEFVRSNEGQRYAGESGLIPFYPTRDKPRIANQKYSARYRSLASLGDRLSVTFAMMDNAQLVEDGKFERDLLRVQQFIQDGKAKNLVLVDVRPGSNSNEFSPAIQRLESLLQTQNIPVYDKVLVTNGPEEFLQRSAQIEIWTL